MVMNSNPVSALTDKKSCPSKFPENFAKKFCNTEIWNPKTVKKKNFTQNTEFLDFHICWFHHRTLQLEPVNFENCAQKIRDDTVKKVLRSILSEIQNQKNKN